MDLTNASAIVTGGAGGFGSATVRKLGGRAYVVSVLDNSPPTSRYYTRPSRGTGRRRNGTRTCPGCTP
jgi:NAD(P)-dependent dehydrogenase (short-subunit alcohol dehydrogenase family)